MKLKFFTLLSLAAVLVLASCSQKNENNAPSHDRGEETAAYLRIKTSGSRADESSADGTSATLYSALIYFLDGDTDPLIYDIVTVGSNGQDLTVAQLEEGYKIEGISSEVTQVYIVGNYNSTDSQGTTANLPLDEGQRLSDIESTIWNIEQISHGSLADGTTTASLITIMDGQATLQNYGTDPGDWGGDATPADNDMYAEVILTPMVARLEIGELSYTGTLNAFTMYGIFVNYFYENLPMTLDTSGYAPINFGSDVSRYVINGPNFAYTDYMTLYNYIGTPVTPSGSATFQPDDEVWAYQVFGNSSPVPHIIIKLTGVTASSGVYLGDRYVTVRGFLNGATEINTFERNTIYRITSLEFDDEDISILPEPETIDVWVHVEVAPWLTVDVSPII